MNWIAIAIALASLGASAWTTRRHHKVARALEKSEEEKKQLVETLVEVMDEEGNIRGQLALPGAPVASTVSNRLAIAEKSVSSIQDEIRKQTKRLREEVGQAAGDLREARGALEAAQSREARLEKTLAEVVDGDGTVLAQLRLPGRKMDRPPNKTPCGDMCKLSFFIRDRPNSKNGTWRCVPGQGQVADKVRKQFEDANGQCVLFERDDDC
jgi:hypothetical protein